MIYCLTNLAIYFLVLSEDENDTVKNNHGLSNETNIISTKI